MRCLIGSVKWILASVGRTLTLDPRPRYVFRHVMGQGKVGAATYSFHMVSTLALGPSPRSVSNG